jgi:hypothetical protein
LLEEGASLIHVSSSSPPLANLSMVKSLGYSERATSALLSLVLQAFEATVRGGDFPQYLTHSGILAVTPGHAKNLGQEVTKVFANLLLMDETRKWRIMINDVDDLEKEAISEIGKVLGRLVEPSSPYRMNNLRVAVLGEDPIHFPTVARHVAVVDENTEYLGM